MKNYGAMSSFRFLASFRVTSAPATAFATVFATISALVLVGTALLAPPAFADPPWQITSEDGESSLRFGLLAQARAEAVDTAGGDTAQDLFLRRLRFLVRGELGEHWSFFLETDSPNLGKSDEDIFLQDVVLTYKRDDAFHLDMGLLLIENSYNSNQGAVNLLASDYGAFSFVDNGPLEERIGRDVGVRARGYLAGGHLEYRAGVYEGVRGEDRTHAFRFVGRLMWNVFEAQKGLFYLGNSLGTKKILSVGTSYDTQEGYEANGADLFLDLPVRDGDGLSFQLDWTTWDGGSFLPGFARQDTILAELGYYSSATKLLPYVQFSARDLDDPGLADEDRLQVGVGWMMAGHGRSLKLAYTRIATDGLPDRDQLWLTFQLFVL